MLPEAEFQPQNENTLAHRLAMTYSSMTDFSTAIDTVRELPESEQPTTYLAISDDLVDAGFGVIPVINQFLSLVEGAQSETPSIHPFLAYLYARDGDFSKALEIASEHARTFNPELPWDEVYLTIGVSQHLAGVNPHDAFDRALQAIEYLTPAERKIGSYLQAATVFSAAGVDPTPAFQSAEMAQSFATRKTNHDTLLFIHSLVACGKLDEAQKLLSTFQPDANPSTIKHYRNLAYKHIAEGYLKRGKISLTIDFSMQTTDNHIKTDLLAETAIKSAERKMPAAVAFLAKAVESRLGKIQTLEQVRVLAKISYALSLIGDEQEQIFYARALGRAVSLRDAHEKALAYLTIGEYEAKKGEKGQDAQAMLTLASEQAEKMIEQPSLVMHGTNITQEEQDDIYGDIIVEATSHGYLNLTEVILDRLKNPKNKARGLAEIGKMKAGFALSIGELSKLSPEKIRAVLNGNNELAKQAIIHFALDKKLT